MASTEWIISIDDDLKDFDEMFVGNVRDGDVLIRCKDCEFFHSRSVYGHGLCDVHCNGLGECEVVNEKYYCSWAERKER